MPEMTRRKLAAATLIPVAAAAQATPAAQPPDELQAARDANLRNGEMLAKFPVPIETEPAFQFKA